jgi:hypothetical protein
MGFNSVGKGLVKEPLTAELIYYSLYLLFAWADMLRNGMFRSPNISLTLPYSYLCSNREIYFLCFLIKGEMLYIYIFFFSGSPYNRPRRPRRGVDV